MSAEGDAREALSALEERLDRAAAAAERLVAEAGHAAAQRIGARIPPAGWQAPGSGDDRSAGWRQSAELEPLVEALRALRQLVPPELGDRVAVALRELLLAVRALIDWYVERTERERSVPPEVQDIPVL